MAHQTRELCGALAECRVPESLLDHPAARATFKPTCWPVYGSTVLGNPPSDHCGAVLFSTSYRS